MKRVGWKLLTQKGNRGVELRKPFKASRRDCLRLEARISGAIITSFNKKHTGDRSNKREVILTVVPVRCFDIFRSNSASVFELRTCQVCLCLWHCHERLPQKISNVQPFRGESSEQFSPENVESFDSCDSRTN
jgi:hypothetical protein